jgi:hypothetical protein
MAHAAVGQPRQRNATGGSGAGSPSSSAMSCRAAAGCRAGGTGRALRSRRRARHQRGTGSARSGRDRRRDLPRSGGKRHETQTVRAPTHADVVTSARRRAAGRVTGRRSAGPIRALWCVRWHRWRDGAPKRGSGRRAWGPCPASMPDGRGVERLGERTRDVGRRAQPLLALVGYDLAFPFGPLPGRPRLGHSSDERHQPRRDCVAQEGDQRRHQGWWRRTDATRGLLAVPEAQS